MNSKFKPALLGGLFVGLLSAIPVVNFANVCCCLWAILGGLLASYLYIKNSVTPARAGDGAIVGLLAGVVGAGVYVIIGIPLSILTQGTINEIVMRIVASMNPAQVESIRQAMAGQSTLGAIVWGLFVAFLIIIFSAVGGLLGIPIFEKRKGTTGIAPPPPGGFGEPG